jgi:RHS repeat-associated protein
MSLTVPAATSSSSRHSFSSTTLDLLSVYAPPTDGLASSQTSYAYNADRLLQSISIPVGSPLSETIPVGYDAFGRLSSIFDPLSGVTTQLAYNTADQVVTASRNDGTTLAYTYDGFLTTSAVLTGTVSGSVSWTYDTFIRVAQRSVNGGNTVIYGYDNDNLLTGTSSPAFTIARDYANGGRIAGTTLGSVIDASGYNGFSELMTYTATSGATTPYELTVAGRDLNGRIIAVTEQVNGATHDWSFAYDSRGRLTSATRDSTTNTYTYDPNGNRLTMSGGEAWTYDGQDRLLSAPGISYTYRNDGTATSKTTSVGTYGYVYDLGGFLQSVSLPSGNSVQYTADARNRRIARSLTSGSATISQQFVYDSQLRVAAELSNNGATVTSVFVYGTKANVPDYMIHGSALYRIISDWVGSVRLVVNAATGAIVQELDYDEFGNVLQSSFDTTCAPNAQCFPFQPFGFAGGLQDRDTGIVRFGARDYDPQVGRWLSKDSSRFAGGLNFYGYAGGDPVNFIDPNGKIIVPIVVVAIAVALAVFGESDMGGDMSANLGPVLALGGSGLAASLALDASIDAVLAQLAQTAPAAGSACATAAPLVYGPSAGGQLAATAAALGGVTLTALGNFPDMTWEEFSYDRLTIRMTANRSLGDHLSLAT